MLLSRKQCLDPERPEVSWAQIQTLREPLAARTHLGKSEASRALGLLGPASLCSPVQQEPRGPRGHLRGEREH